MNRREFLAVTGIGALLELENFMFFESYLTMRDTPVDGANVDAASLVGFWYLTNHPGEADRITLLSSLSDCTPEVCKLDGFSLKQLDSNLIRRSSMMDYECGDVVYAGGWQLARTEARVCALIALS